MNDFHGILYGIETIKLSEKHSEEFRGLLYNHLGAYVDPCEFPEMMIESHLIKPDHWKNMKDSPCKPYLKDRCYD